jgi:NAD(P) transhydrogenase subunit alpha
MARRTAREARIPLLGSRNAMKVAVAREVLPGETRVALIPDTVKQLVAKGHRVRVEAGAGQGAFFLDEDYVKAGAEIEPARQALFIGCDVLVKVNKPARQGEPGGDEVSLLRAGSALVSFLQPFSSRPLLEELAERRVTAFAMEMIPRISRAQNMDALTSMATVAGYKSVLLAAEHLPRFFPMLMTAAGTIAPARALIIGAGVAGLQAVATAKRLGAVVEAFDARPVVKEQVESLGARFVGLEVTVEEAQDAGGYAKQLSEEQHRRELELIAQFIGRADVVITTAQVPGKKAPLLITEEMVKGMKPGAVIVDLAVETGGNCALTEHGKTVVKHGVTLVGLTNLPRTMPVHASQMYSRNVANLLLHLAGPDGVKLDLEDPITSGTMVTHAGTLTHPALKG